MITRDRCTGSPPLDLREYASMPAARSAAIQMYFILPLNQAALVNMTSLVRKSSSFSGMP
jgi:hypothetical protein